MLDDNFYFFLKISMQIFVFEFWIGFFHIRTIRSSSYSFLYHHHRHILPDNQHYIMGSVKGCHIIIIFSFLDGLKITLSWREKSVRTMKTYANQKLTKRFFLLNWIEQKFCFKIYARHVLGMHNMIIILILIKNEKLKKIFSSD